MYTHSFLEKVVVINGYLIAFIIVTTMKQYQALPIQSQEEQKEVAHVSAFCHEYSFSIHILPRGLV